MDRKEAVNKLTAQLERERERHGRMGEIDLRMGHRDGYLRRMLDGKIRMTVGEICKALEAMEVEPAEFFAQAFDIVPRPEDLLRRQEAAGPAGRELRRIEAAALALETRARGEGEAPAEPKARKPVTRSTEQLESLTRTVLSHQRDLLRKESWVLDAAMLRQYLEQLDGLRFDRAEDSAALAEMVAVTIVPHVDAPNEVRLELMCRAIGVFASGRRVKGKFATAARAAGFALRLAGRHGLIAEQASLLQRGAYVLRDAGEWDHALVLLDKAQNLWLELGSRAEVGKALIDRAIILGHRSDVPRADAVFKLGLSYLSGNSESHRMYRLSAAHGIAFTQLRMGDPDQADCWLRRAIDLVSDDEPVALAKLIRQQGEIYYGRGDYIKAEIAFSNARRTLNLKENAIQGALVALDVAAALDAQGKTRQLRQLAEEMTSLLVHFSDNKLAEAALMAFIRAGCEGKVNEKLINEVGKKLGRTRPLVRARPSRPLPTRIDKRSQSHRP